MSDTPRTDAEVMYADCADSCLEVYVTRRADGKSHDGDIVSGDFARTLERELSAARAELATARECLLDIEYDQDGIPCQWPTREKRDKAAGMDATAGEVKA